MPNTSLKSSQGGEGSNYQKERIIKESPLIEVYKNIRIQLQDTFQLSNHTSRHSLPDMTQTFAVLEQYMHEHKAFMYIPGRTASYTVPDAIADGLGILLSSDTFDDVEITGESMDGDDEQEVDDEGDLAVE